MRKTLSTLILAGIVSGCVPSARSSELPHKINSTSKEIQEKVIKDILPQKISYLDISSDSKIPQNYEKIAEITKYLPIRQDISFQGKNYTAIREFFRGESKYFLAVDLESNKTKIIPAEDAQVLTNNSNFEKSSYNAALNSLKGKNGIANVGLGNDIKYHKNTVYMTADFCPSSKTGFEKEFFENFIKKGHKNVAIAITSAWIKKHEKSFEWLIEQKEKHNLNITWVNHSTNHKYDWGEPLEKNFLLKSGTDLAEEVLEVEKRLIENGQTPSIFMRFPGLVSNEKIREEIINKYSLVFIGSDAWLAKGETPKNGSIILIHGNRNEPLGIQKANQYLKNKDEKIKFGDLTESL